MSEVEGTEIIEDEKIEKAPAEELVEMILSGELHAANEKFSELVEGKVIEAIEEEKHKIAQTLFAEEEIEEAKAKVKEDDEDGDGDDDDVEPDDDDDEEDEDDSPVGKADEGKIPPQFLKKGDDDSDDEEDDDDDKEDDDDDEKEDTKEGITGDPEANEKALAKNRAMAKKYGQVRQGIPPEKKTEAVEPEQSFDPGEESTNVKLPENSFVAQVAKHLSGTGYIKEDLGRDIENGFKKLSNKKAKAGKQDSFEGSAIKCGDYKVTPGKTHDASDTTPGADESIAFYVSVQDSSGKEVTDQIDASGGGDAIDFDTETGKMSSGDKKTAKEIEKWCKS